LHQPDPRSARDVSKEERLETYERFWSRPGFEKYLSIFYDVGVDPVANEEYSEFIRVKVREIVRDPALAEKLVAPKDLPFASRRIPLETGYYEAYNQPNVMLVDVRETPIERITPMGVQTSAAEYELDMLIFATGFDSFTGGFTRIDVRGLGSQTLKEKWDENGPENYLSLMTAGFPNFFTLVSRLAGNYARTTEVAVDFVADTLRYMYDHQLTRIVPTEEAEQAWVEHELSFTKGRELLTGQKSWFNGGNIPGKKLYPPYFNTLPNYRKELAAVVEHGYAGFELGSGPMTVEPEDVQLEDLFIGLETSAREIDSIDNVPV
jgi:cation diffusion facilitator CzcD-associated flavoprotein CzcO